MKIFVTLAGILVLALTIWISLICVISVKFSATHFRLWIISAAICLAWGVFILRWTRLTGWVCIGFALTQFAEQLFGF
jgi:hypothetical protein